MDEKAFRPAEHVDRAGLQGCVDAALRGDLAKVQELWRPGFHASAGRDGVTPLIGALIGRHARAAVWLAPRSDLAMRDAMGRTALLVAAPWADASVIVPLLGPGGSMAKLGDAKARGEWTPLMAAAKAGNLEGVEALAEFSDVDAQNHLGMTAAMLAGAAEQASCLERICRASDPAVENASGSNLLHYAAVFSAWAARDLARRMPSLVLSRNASGMTPLMSAAGSAGSCPLAFEAILEASGEAAGEQADSRGRTPLMIAVNMGNAGAAKALANPASCRACDADGADALSIAIHHEDAAMALLLAPLSDMERRKDGMTPLMAAARKGNLSIVRTLAQRSVPMALDPTGLSPHGLAEQEGHLEVAEFLRGWRVAHFEREALAGLSAGAEDGPRNRLRV